MRAAVTRARVCSRPFSCAVTDAKSYYHGILPDVVAQLRMFLSGDSFTSLLSALTGEKVSTVASEVRCFGPGDYTMICDPQYKQRLRSSKEAKVKGGGSGGGSAGAADGDGDGDGDDGIVGWIDVTLTVVEAEEWPESHGGFVSYLTYDEPLLNIPPKRNSLAIVYRTVGRGGGVRRRE